MERDPKNSKLFVDGVEIGAITTASFPRAEQLQPPQKIQVNLAFRPNWVGLWKLQAHLAGREDLR